MRSCWAIAAIMALCLLLGAQHAFAVGYVRYPSGNTSANHARTYPETRQGLCQALSSATFANRSAKLLDEVTLSIKDILGQFGLGEVEHR